MTGHGGPDPMTGLHDQLGVLGVALAQWDDRDRARDQVAARRKQPRAVRHQPAPARGRRTRPALDGYSRRGAGSRKLAPRTGRGA